MPALLKPLRDCKGGAAVEFALIAGPLLFLIFACFELAFVVLISVTLDNATDLAAREIRTGITTQGNSTAVSFRQKICGKMGWMVDTCNANMLVDVQTFDSFAKITNTNPIKDGKLESANMVYNIGGGSKIQLVRAYFEWPMFTPLLSSGMTTLANKDVVISSKVVFRNEPF